jgi:hypothetical protein
MEKGERPVGHPAESVDVKETAVSHTESRQSSHVADRDGLAKEIGATIQEAKEETGGPTEDEEDDVVYPQKWKLALITIALCLSVFCMALGMFFFPGYTTDC